VIKVSGHRIGTAEIEDTIVGHASVAEAAVTSRPDEVKGESIVVFVTLVAGAKPSDDLKKEIREAVRQGIGAVAVPGEIYFVDSVPKTRSGKIMRRILKAVASDEEVGDVTTLENEASVEEARKAYQELKAASEAS